ncbi:efflux RND transporter periplasmic adaptor subunit [Allomuricauda sp. XS_ASV26]|jgi:RND family efflux transporter MFP subunit|uniref:RND transporter n=1 Tax=Flagellimonas marinaquae TaxID=254955 RepID=A0AA48KL08_9FLAO|nr:MULTISPECIES: efflux RND transporter periplasmic adaptor subunit [Allomuricauda]MCA0958475.1 efflux RND transporter periplasmic adaptor subunit [Allomuricauda ruestringensis]USD26816.1 efflux RND transporter periplasmic adaptor subunit [Allomuricauda aquimarina]BDW92582.1 RND transporter [Allomuricauda aquimarina]
MKKAIYITLTAAVLASCGGNGNKSLEKALSSQDVEVIRAKHAEISIEKKALESQLKSLDSAIALLDGSAKLPLVTTIEVHPQRFDHYLELQGDVMTKQNVLIYPEMSGTLNKVYVKEGQKVTKGQLLATIDDGGLSSQLAQLRTQAELSKTTFERQKRLWEQNIGSEIQYLQAKTNYEAQQSAVKQMESQVGKSSIRAPFTGIIDDVIKDQGTVVSPGPGSEVFRIVNLSNMYIEVEVPESHLQNVTPGKDVKVYFPVLGDSVNTKIRQTGNFINPSNRSFTAEIPVPSHDGKIKPNLTARVMINDYTSENAILIPQSILSENADGEQYVLLVAADSIENNPVAKKVVIKTGKTQGDYVEVLSGINEGDAIIDEGARSVKEGQQVNIKNS